MVSNKFDTSEKGRICNSIPLDIAKHWRCKMNVPCLGPKKYLQFLFFIFYIFIYRLQNGFIIYLIFQLYYYWILYRPITSLTCLSFVPLFPSTETFLFFLCKCWDILYHCSKRWDHF